TLPHEKAWERQRTERERSPFIERKELRRRLRAAAAGATSEAEFVQRVYSSGVILRPRFATGRTDQITGYSVALPPPDGVDREPVFYSPAKHLDKNLSLPKVRAALGVPREGDPRAVGAWQEHHSATRDSARSEEHTSELQSRFDLVCRLLLEKKKTTSYRAGAGHVNSIQAPRGARMATRTSRT